MPVKTPRAGRPREDVILTRRAAYLVAMNGDPRKTEVAFAQQYFAAADDSVIRNFRITASDGKSYERQLSFGL